MDGKALVLKRAQEASRRLLMAAFVLFTFAILTLGCVLLLNGQTSEFVYPETVEAASSRGHSARAISVLQQVPGRPTTLRRLPPIHGSASIENETINSDEELPAIEPPEQAPEQLLGPVPADMSERETAPAIEPPRTQLPAGNKTPFVPASAMMNANVTAEPIVDAVKPAVPPLVAPNPPADRANAWQRLGPAAQPVVERAQRMIESSFALAERGALYSARAELKQALETVAQTIDAQSGGNDHSKDLAAAWTAIDEADDFIDSTRGPAGDVATIVAVHRTPLLKPYDLSSVQPVLAVQYYYTFAQERLASACGNAPVASRAAFGLGKLYMVMAERSPTEQRRYGPKAMALHQAAMLIDPSNYLAANELGVLLARFGQWTAARNVLQHSASIRALPETWRNLAVVNQKLGDAQRAGQSYQQWHATSQQPQMPAAPGMVQYMPVGQFRASAPPVGPAVPRTQAQPMMPQPMTQPPTLPGQPLIPPPVHGATAPRFQPAAR